MTRASLFLCACLAASTAVRPAFATEAPFEPGLMRLAEVLGSLHFLRNLCGEKGDQWRVPMEEGSGRVKSLPPRGRTLSSLLPTRFFPLPGPSSPLHTSRGAGD